jgi:outer membrane protein assembly factor BamB
VIGAYKDTLLVGQGSSLVGIDPNRGSVRWEVPLASPRGTNEVERLADLVGPPARVGSVYCVRSFQSAVGCVDAERAALVWSKNIAGASRVAADEQFVFAVDSSDRLNAWKRANGDTAWSADRFLNRGLSGPASVGQTLVFGDREGYVHFLSRDTGKTLLRLTTDGSAVVGAPAIAGTTIVVTTRNGGVFAFRPE